MTLFGHFNEKTLLIMPRSLRRKQHAGGRLFLFYTSRLTASETCQTPISDAKKRSQTLSWHRTQISLDASCIDVVNSNTRSLQSDTTGKQTHRVTTTFIVKIACGSSRGAKCGRRVETETWLTNDAKNIQSKKDKQCLFLSGEDCKSAADSACPHAQHAARAPPHAAALLPSCASCRHNRDR